MHIIAGLWTYLLPFLVVLTILIFVHEFGHYLIARRCGVKVEVFSFGFGPELFGYTDVAGTRWKCCAIPLGGYVKMFGDADAASTPDERVTEMSAEEKAVSFYHKRVGQRIAIVAAGPLANYLFAVVVLALLFMTSGQPFVPAVIGKIQPGSAAEAAGFVIGDAVTAIDGVAVERFEQLQQIVRAAPGRTLAMTVKRNGRLVVLSATPRDSTTSGLFGLVRFSFGVLGVGAHSAPVIGSVVGLDEKGAGLTAGDTILSVDGTVVESFDQVMQIVRRSPGQALQITVERGGRKIELQATPEAVRVNDRNGSTQTVGRLSIGRAIAYRQYDPFSAVLRAVDETVSISRETLAAIGQMMVGARGTEEFGGPLRIAEMSGDVARNGLVSLIWFIAMLSINLGLINLFPIPLLDGGHLMFYGIEAIRGRPLSERAQEYGFRIGLALVLTLMVFATWNDLVHLRVVEFVMGLFF
ncbi:Zinc metalloprotease [uncultured Gammaproteobacteria bacterium]